MLRVLALADAEFTVPTVRNLVDDYSEPGIRKSLQRLARQGIVRESRAGHAWLYSLNREHLAAPHIEALARLSSEFRTRVAGVVRSWNARSPYVALFGSAARGDMTPESDIDVLIVRPSTLPDDSEVWDDQLRELSSLITRWTGNDARVLEMTEREVEANLRKPRSVLSEVRSHGIPLDGRSSYLNERS